jgi:hypothetical protein
MSAQPKRRDGGALAAPSVIAAIISTAALMISAMGWRMVVRP